MAHATLVKDRVSVADQMVESPTKEIPDWHMCEIDRREFYLPLVRVNLRQALRDG